MFAENQNMVLAPEFGSINCCVHGRGSGNLWLPSYHSVSRARVLQPWTQSRAGYLWQDIGLLELNEGPAMALEKA